MKTTLDTATSEKTEVPQIASFVHLGGFLLIMAGLVAWGFHTQQAGIGKAGTAAAGQLAGHGEAWRFYLTSILGNCGLFYYCWAGVHHYGGNLGTLSGGRWTSWKSLFSDVAIALPFWVLWEATANGVQRLLGPSEAKSAADLLPRSWPEIALWIVVSITAGFTEEIQCRGYLQRQLHALSGNVVTAVLGQALVFGLIHSYQGWKQTVVIGTLGILYGTLAAWRKNLRANMIAHAWSDVWEGWLKQIVWR